MAMKSKRKNSMYVVLDMNIWGLNGLDIETLEDYLYIGM